MAGPQPCSLRYQDNPFDLIFKPGNSLEFFNFRFTPLSYPVGILLYIRLSRIPVSQYGRPFIFEIFYLFEWVGQNGVLRQ